jgi:uncharacterized phage protein (TIGR02220 family)
MSKRFIATELVNKRWFRILPINMKFTWIYLTLICDHAGIVEFDDGLFSFHLNEDISKEELLKYFSDKITFFDDDSKIFIKDFVNFQYGELNENNRVHRSVLNILHKNNINVKKNKPLVRPLKGCKDKDKDKDKDNTTAKYNAMRKEVMDYLRSGLEKDKGFGHNNVLAKLHMNARFNEGVTVEEMKLVIDSKLRDEYFIQHPGCYQPQTIFSNKFHGYLDTANVGDLSEAFKKKRNKDLLAEINALSDHS